MKPSTQSESQSMTTYYVATFNRYVLVDADDEAQAREAAQPALADLHADLDHGKGLPINILTVRPATDDEIEFWNLNIETTARELKLKNG
jgi:hypothetical protein